MWREKGGKEGKKKSEHLEQAMISQNVYLFDVLFLIKVQFIKMSPFEEVQLVFVVLYTYDKNNIYYNLQSKKDFEDARLE